jgi:hypothetical protein
VTRSVRNILIAIAAIGVAGVVLTQVRYVPKASAEDFGVGTVECAAAVGPTSTDVKVLEASGWKIRDSRKGSAQYERNGLGVRLILAEGQPGCLTRGVAESVDEFPVINAAVSAALKAKYGAQFKALEPTTPNRQTFLTGDLFHLVAGEKTSDGFEVRVISAWDQSRQ